MPASGEQNTRRRLLGPKVLLPRAPADLVTRPELISRLERGRDRKLTLVVAPAGYGKTTLLAAWLKETSSPAAYLALDEYDADVTAFLIACIQAVRRVAPEFGADTLALLQLAEHPSLALLASTLAAEAIELDPPVVLVLDDYHTVNSPDVDQLLTELLRRLPSGLHLVLATREEAALPLARLRARAELTELHADDLRFAPNDARALLGRMGQPDPAPGLLATLMERTEGWAAGLRLAGISLAGALNTEGRMAAREDASWRFAHDFLLADVLAAQDPAVQRFLLETSILDRFCAPLCDAVLANTSQAGSSQAVLDLLERRELFIVRLAEEGPWYRYHSLFREALQARLEATYDAGAIVALHQRASAWLAAEGWVSEAVRQALAANDEAVAAAIVESRVDAVLGREDWPAVEEWLRLLPPGLVRGRPALLIAHAWVQFLRFRMQVIPPVLAVVNRLLDQPNTPRAREDDTLRGESDGLLSTVLLVQDVPERTWDAAWRAFERIPPTRAYPRGAVAAILAMTAPAVGQSARLESMLEERLAASAGINPNETARVRGALGFLSLELGDLARLQEVAEPLLQETTALDLKLATAWCHYWLGRVYYEWDEPAIAEAHFAAVHALRGNCHFLLLRNAMHGLALCQQAQGRADAAAQTVVALRAWVAELHDRAQLLTEDAFQARLALVRGDPAPAEQWLQHAEPVNAFRYVMAVEVPELTRVRALLARGTAPAAQEAAAEVATLLPQYQARHDTLRVGELLGLEAMARHALGDTPAALDGLEQMLHLAEPAGRVRLFVDLGAPMARLLALFATRRGDTPYIRRLLAACGGNTALHAPVQHDRQQSAPLVEPLTWREDEVLRLLAAHHSNKEIARLLHVSPSTAKKHTMNIYHKLGASGRRHAVLQAVALGLLPAAPATEPGSTAPAEWGEATRP